MTQGRHPNSFLKQVFVTQTKVFVDVLQKRQFWTDFAEEIKETFKISQTISNDLTSFTLRFHFENGYLEFIESDTHSFKVFCELNSEKQIEFSIAHKDFIDRILKVLGSKDIEFSYPEFDKKYLV